MILDFLADDLDRGICIIQILVYNPAYNPARDLLSERGFRMLYGYLSDEILGNAIRDMLGIVGVHEAQLKGQEGYGEPMSGTRVQHGVDAWRESGHAPIPQIRIVYSLPAEADLGDGYVMQAPVRREALKLVIEGVLRPYGIFVKEWNEGRDEGVTDSKRWLEFVFDTRVTDLRLQDDALIADYLTDVCGLLSVALVGANGERLEMMNEEGALTHAFTESWKMRRVVAKCNYVEHDPLAIWEGMAWVFGKFGYIPILKSEQYDVGGKTGEWRFVILEKEERKD